MTTYQNPYFVCFKNGVYDLQLNEFSSGKHGDFISKTLPIDYKVYEECDEDVQNVKNFLMKVFPDEEIRRYFLDTYSDVFVGGNNQKNLYMWIGDGDNGKTTTHVFFDKMLGEHAIQFDPQYFTDKKVALGEATLELSRAVSPVCFVTMEDSGVEEQLNVGALKILAGGDSYFVRDLFEKDKTAVTPRFMLTFVCNKLPQMKYSDEVTWNRLRVIPFESHFVEQNEQCPDTLEGQLREKRFPMDKDFKNKIPGMISAFAWYLLEWRKKSTFRHEPDKVRV